MPTLVRSNRLFPNHAQIGSFSETIPVVAGSTVSFTADQLLVVADTMNPGQFLRTVSLLERDRQSRFGSEHDDDDSRRRLGGDGLVPAGWSGRIRLRRLDLRVFE